MLVDRSANPFNKQLFKPYVSKAVGGETHKDARDLVPGRRGSYVSDYSEWGSKRPGLVLGCQAWQAKAVSAALSLCSLGRSSEAGISVEEAACRCPELIPPGLWFLSFKGSGPWLLSSDGWIISALLIPSASRGASMQHKPQEPHAL